MMIEQLDVEPVIDTIRSVHKQFKNQIAASFLKLRIGQIVDQPIQREDIKTFAEICSHEIASGKDDVIKLVYLRRKYEIVDGKGDAYQVLSNLLHKRMQAQAIDNRIPMDANGLYPAMEGHKFSLGCAAIGAEIVGFDYAATLNKLSDPKELRLLYASSQNGYEKLQIFRLLELDVKNSVIQKFINETYHIENEFICQLDPAKLDTVPEYVIEECDKLLAMAA